ncbi:MAG TPA: hypothetical protein VK400_20845 [Pyrinomonadaceae bacterium]|nr:hypothetical protein [Pyrinomonadaceae bacterium]
MTVSALIAPGGVEPVMQGHVTRNTMRRFGRSNRHLKKNDAPAKA